VPAAAAAESHLADSLPCADKSKLTSASVLKSSAHKLHVAEQPDVRFLPRLYAV